MKQISERNLSAHQNNLDSSFDELKAAYEEAVDAIENLNQKIGLYNLVVEDSEDFIEGVVARAEKHYEISSQKWRDSHEGELYLRWINEMKVYPGFLDRIDQVAKPDLKNAQGSSVLDLPLSPEDLVNKEI